MFAHQHGDGVEGVEEEVRVKLHLQRVELGLRELRLQVGPGELLLAVAAAVLQGEARGERAPVGEHREEGVLHHHQGQRAQQWVVEEPRLARQPPPIEEEGAVAHGQHEVEAQVCGDAGGPAPRAWWQPPAERQDGGSAQRPELPGWELEEEGLPEGVVRLLLNGEPVGLVGGDEPRDGPQQDQGADASDEPRQAPRLGSRGLVRGGGQQGRGHRGVEFHGPGDSTPPLPRPWKGCSQRSPWCSERATSRPAHFARAASMSSARMVRWHALSMMQSLEHSSVTVSPWSTRAASPAMVSRWDSISRR